MPTDGMPGENVARSVESAIEGEPKEELKREKTLIKKRELQRKEYSCVLKRRKTGKDI